MATKSTMDTKAALKALAGLAQESRLAIVRNLVERGAIGAYAGQLAEDLQCAPATLSFHLKELSHAGLIEAQHEGRHIRYVASFQVMNGLIEYLTHNCCGGRADCFPGSACESIPKPKPKRAAAARKVAAPRRRAG